MFETIARLALHVYGSPESLAVDDGETRLSYSELWSAANALRARIDAVAVDRDSPVFVCLERSAPLVVAYCAALIGGRTCVPMDPAHPASFKQSILQTVGRGVVLVSPQSRNDFATVEESLVVVDELEVRSKAFAPEPSTPDAEFILFTSGSTGKSKGVRIAASAMLRTADALADRLGLSAGARVLHFAAPAFDSSTLEWIIALTNGVPLVIVPDALRNDPVLLGQFMVDMSVTHAILPSAILPYLPLREDYALAALIVAGDVCPEPVLWDWAGKYATYNGYGPTEGTVCTSVTRVSSGEAVSIHDTIDNLVLRLRDGQDHDADFGEIWIGGPQVALGYLTEGDGESSAFTVDGNGIRWFMTGDWAERQADGRLRFAGRRDAQVKVRGNRVDLSQLDHVAAAVSDVLAVCSLAHATGAGEKQLFLFAASSLEPKGMRERIAKAIKAQLPNYYMPTAIHVMDSLPRSANDKIDRAALRASLDSAPDPADRLSALFAETSGTTTLAEDDNFFACGGNSIAVLRLLQSVQKDFGKHVPLRAFQENPTLGGLRRILADANKDDSEITRSGLRREGRYPLTPQQEAIWFLHQSNPESKAYLAEASIWFEGSFIPQAMEGALNDVFARHEIYRTFFGEENGTPFQHVLDRVDLSLPRLDRTEVIPADRDAELAAIFASELPHIADLSAAPPARFVLVAFAPDLHVLLHQEHHIIHDGWSGNVFTDELIHSYGRRVDAGRAPQLRPVAQYLDFAEAQQKFLTSAEADRQLTYWRDQLAACPDGVALFGKRSPAIGFDGGVERMVFSGQEWQRIEAGCRDLGITTFAFTAAILFLTLSRHSGQDDITIGSAFANRSWTGGHDVLGMLVNTIVLRHKFGTDVPLSETLRAVHHTVQAAQANERYPFARLVEKLNPERSGANPFFNVLLGFHDTPLTAETPAGLSWRKDETVESATSKFDLDCLVIPRKTKFRAQNEVHFLWEYRSDIYTPAEIRTFLENFRHQFLTAFDQLDSPVEGLTGLCPEQATRLAGWARGPRLDIGAGSLVDEIRKNALERPESPALRDDSGDLSYADLFTKAGVLAEKMKAAGLGAGGCVALALPRGNELAVGFLASWIANSTVVVIDTDLPEQRLAHLMEKAQPQIIVEPGLKLRTLSQNLGQNADPERAYIVFTSGSTGQPKGVEVSHANLRNLCHLHRDLFHLDHGTVAASIAHTAFDAYIGEVWPVLLAGGCVVSLSDATRNDMSDFATALSREGVTHCCLTTGFFETALSVGLVWPATLKTLLTGGDRLGPVTLPRVNGLRLFNMYGPTEATVDALGHELHDDYVAPPPIGRPVSNALALVVDAKGRLCPPGVEGELIVGGAGVAKGYLAQPDLTDERFVSGAALGLDPTQRFYRTGDYACWSQDGEMQFIGRRDTEIKIRGFRVNLAEISRQLRQDPRVAHAIAAQKAGQLVAYVVPSAEVQHQLRAGILKPQKLSRQLNADLRKSLPQFMRPSALLVLESIPLTAQGKVDQAALPSPIEEQSGFAPPETATEKAVAAIWAEYLERPQISVKDSFFTIGGHSLMAIKIISRLGQEFGVTLKLEDFFNAFTIRSLSQLIDILVGIEADAPPTSPLVEEGEL